MNTEQAQALERLVREYRQRKAQIRSDESLSWEKQELQIKQLGDEYHRARKEMEAA